MTPPAPTADAARRFVLEVTNAAGTERLTFDRYGEADRVAYALRDTGCYFLVLVRDRGRGTVNLFRVAIDAAIWGATFALSPAERADRAPVRHLWDAEAYRHVGASSTLSPGLTDDELAAWALDNTLPAVAETAVDDDRSRLAAWVREGAASVARDPAPRAW